MPKINNYNLSTVQVEKNIKKPQKGGGRDNKWFLLFVKMQIGDSFALQFKDDEEAIKIQGAIYNSKKNYIKKHDSTFDGSSRILFIKKEVRFWRDK